ncbi:MAG TPA: hypothetical protein VIW24_21245 [Aldersonia sp.]
MTVDDTATPPLGPDERAELERLRAEVAELRAQSGEPPTVEPKPRTDRHAWRWVAVALLLVLAGLFTLGSVTTRFVRAEILDTDHYVATVAPLGSDPAVQTQVVDTITGEINSRVDVEALTTQALTALTDLTPADRPRLDQAVVGLAPVLAGQAENFIRETVTRFVDSPEFEDLWVAANRQAHTAVVAVVTGETNRQAVVVGADGTISIALGPIIDQVKQRLNDRGFAFADKIPAVDKQFVLFQSPDIVRAQRLVNALDKVATVLPWLALAAGAGAVAAAPRGRRMRALMLFGVTIVVSMLILAIGILVGRAVYLDQIPPSVMSAGAATAVFDTVVTPLRTALRAVALLGLVIGVVGFLTGGSRSAGYVRSGIGRGFDQIQRRRKDRPASAFERWAWAARVPLRIAIVTVAALLLMFWRYPTGVVVAWIVVLAVLALVVLEILIRPARHGSGAEAVAAEGT